MAQAWSTGVPTDIVKSSYQAKRQDGTLRTDMETGLPKVRRRFTAVVKSFEGSIIMTQAELTTFESWFDNVIGFGALTFMFPHPITQVSTEMRFIGSYKEAQDEDTMDFEVQLEFEIIP
jgi:hypothetical protein